MAPPKFQQFLADKLSFLPWVGGAVGQGSYFIGGLVLAIMILPIVSAISREVMSTVPPDLKEAVRSRVVLVFAAMALVFLFADWFVPYNYDWLNMMDLDLGSDGPLLVEAEDTTVLVRPGHRLWVDGMRNMRFELGDLMLTFGIFFG